MSLEVCKITGLVAVLLRHVVSHNQLLIERLRNLENKIFTAKYNQLLFIFISNRYCKWNVLTRKYNKSIVICFYLIGRQRIPRITRFSRFRWKTGIIYNIFVISELSV